MSKQGHPKLHEAGAVGGALSLSAVSAALSACCAGPWVVALFGMSGAVLIARLEPYRFALLVPAALLLGWAIWRERAKRGRRLAMRLALGVALMALVASAFATDIAALWARLGMGGG